MALLRFRFPPLIAAISLTALAACACAAAAPAAPLAAGGALDLRAWDFERQGPVSLVGDWDFFPGALLAGKGALEPPRSAGRGVPDQWRGEEAGSKGGTGAATYRLKLMLPENAERRPRLGLRFSTLSTAFELDANGVPIAGAGRPSLDPRDMVPAYRPGVVLLPQTSGPIVLVVRVSNYDYRVGGMWSPFIVGNAEALGRGHWASVTGSLAFASSLALLAVVFAFFIRMSGTGKGFACFCAFALATALRATVTEDYAILDLFPKLGFDALVRIEYLSVYSIFPLSYLFYAILFPEDIYKGLTKVLLGVCAAFLALVPLAPLRILTTSIMPYYALCAVMIGAAASIQIKAVARRRSGAVPLLVGGVALIATGINDILFSTFLANTRSLFSYGMLVFLGGQAYALAERYRRVQAELHEALAEKDLLMKEVHHRVKNSLQIVSSIAALQSHRTKDPAVLAAYASIRDRIRAVSLVHEKLYSLESGTRVDLGAYARDLTTQLSESYSMAGEGIVLDTESLVLPADLCIDLGLILTELVSNAYKHAVKPGERGEIRVRVARELSDLVLSVEDEGPGFPEGANFEGAASLGLRLVTSLAKKRGAGIALRKGPGAKVEIRMPIDLADYAQQQGGMQNA
jgi:two-component sensor histidine kinase